MGLVASQPRHGPFRGVTEQPVCLEEDLMGLPSRPVVGQQFGDQSFELVSGMPLQNWVHYNAERGGYDVRVTRDGSFVSPDIEDYRSSPRHRSPRPSGSVPRVGRRPVT